MKKFFVLTAIVAAFWQPTAIYASCSSVVVTLEKIHDLILQNKFEEAGDLNIELRASNIPLTGDQKLQSEYYDAVVFRKSGNIAAAQAILQRIGKELPQALDLLNEILDSTDHTNYSEREHYLRMSLEMNADNPISLWRLARMYDERARKEERKTYGKDYIPFLILARNNYERLLQVFQFRMFPVQKRAFEQNSGVTFENAKTQAERSFRRIANDLTFWENAKQFNASQPPGRVKIPLPNFPR